MKKSFTTVKNVVPITILTFLPIYLLMLFSGMNYISQSFKPILRLLNLPGECITALIAQFLHFSAGYATVAMLLTEGMIPAKQAIITPLVGSVIVISMVHIKYSLPMYVFLFGKFGGENHSHQVFKQPSIKNNDDFVGNGHHVSSRIEERLKE